MANDEWLLREYFALNDTIAGFDHRFLTIKGWGVTVGLASLGLGFQTTHYGLFLVAAASGLAFLAVEGLTKRHQMRHYLRMREIEVLRARNTDENSSPQIDWRWSEAHSIFMGTCLYQHAPLPKPEPYEQPYVAYRWAWLGSSALPHVVTIILGTILFVLGLLGHVGTSA